MQGRPFAKICASNDRQVAVVRKYLPVQSSVLFFVVEVRHNDEGGEKVAVNKSCWEVK